MNNIYKLFLKEFNVFIQTSPTYSSNNLLIGSDKYGNIYKAKINSKITNFEELDWYLANTKPYDSGFAIGEARTHKKSKYLKVSTPFGTKDVHLVVASCWLIKFHSKEKIIVHHINGNPFDNRISNLEYLTYKQHSKIHSVQSNSGKTQESMKCL